MEAHQGTKALLRATSLLRLSWTYLLVSAVRQPTGPFLAAVTRTLHSCKRAGLTGLQNTFFRATPSDHRPGCNNTYQGFRFALAGVEEEVNACRDDSIEANIESTLDHQQRQLLDWEGFLFAAPKKKVSRSRKRIRNAAKQLKPLKCLVACPNCGNKHKMHHLCPFCFPFIKWIGGKDKGVERAKTVDRIKENLLKNSQQDKAGQGNHIDN